MCVRQQALGHAHRQERNSAVLDQCADFRVGLRISSPLAEDDQRALGAPEHIERALDRGGRGNLGRRSVDDLDQRFLAGFCIHQLAEKFGRQIEIDAARTSRYRCADRARQADADIGGMQHAERRFAKRLGDRELVHLFVVALLEIDDLALGRTGDQDHRKAVGRGIGQRGEAVEETGGGYREADAGLFRQEAGDGCGITGVLFVPERDDANARGLGHAAKVGDRNAWHAVDRGEAVELERVDDEVEAIRLLTLGFGLVHVNALYYCGHSAFSLIFSMLTSSSSYRLSSGKGRSLVKKVPGRALRRKRQGRGCGRGHAFPQVRCRAARALR